MSTDATEQEIVTLAMHWYRNWNKVCTQGPSLDSGHDLGEVPLFEACAKLDGMRRNDRKHVRKKRGP